MATARRPIRGRRRIVTAVLAFLVTAGAGVPHAGLSRTALAAAGSARIAHSDNGVHLRAEPDYGAQVLGTLPDGTAVTLRTDAFDTIYDPDGATRWWPVQTDIGTGWVAGFFLQIGDAGASGPSGGPSSAPAATGAAATGGGFGESADLWSWTARVAEPDGVNFRDAPGMAGKTIEPLKFDDVVELRIDQADTVYLDGSRWWPVRYEGVDGWISGTYLAPTADGSTAGGTSAGEASDVSGDAGQDPVYADVPGKQGPAAARFDPGSYVAAVTDDGTGLNIRADGAPDAERVGSIPETDVVQVMDGPVTDPIGNDWYLITDGSTTGFVDGRYLQKAGQPGDSGDSGPSLQFPSAPKVPALGIATGSFQYPVQGFTLTQGFGCSPYWFEPWNAAVGCNFHNGVDLAVPYGTPMEAADGGVVEQAGWCDCGLGYYVKIDHGNGFKTVYGHMSEYDVTPGEAVSKGEVIGAVGSTGNSTGPHVHFIIDYDGVDENPLNYLP